MDAIAHLKKDNITHKCVQTIKHTQKTTTKNYKIKHTHNILEGHDQTPQYDMGQHCLQTFKQCYERIFSNSFF